jgi:hypothetical protein
MTAEHLARGTAPSAVIDRRYSRKRLERVHGQGVALRAKVFQTAWDGSESRPYLVLTLNSVLQ